MSIRTISEPNEFQRLCQLLLCAEYPDTQIVRDSNGDGGMDAFVPSTKTLYAMYCPEVRPRPREKYQQKIREDLAKAITLRDQVGCDAQHWVFLTPEPLELFLHDYLRKKAMKAGFVSGRNESEPHLLNLLLKHPHLRSQFPDLALTDVNAKLDELLARRGADTRVGLQPSVQSLPTVQVFRADYAVAPEEALRFQRQASSVLPEKLLPPVVHDFVGRAAVMQELETLAEQGRLLIVTGFTGVGKSALLAQMAARKPPANVFWYTCYPKLASLDDLLTRLASFLSSSDTKFAEIVPERAATLLERLNQSACWLFFDDADLVAGDAEWHGFFKLLKDHLRSGAAFLACCTKPDFLTPLDEASQKTHVFHLGGLPTEDVNKFLRANGLALTLPTAQEITDKLGGQPMALRLLATLAETDASERALLVHAEKAREQTVDYLSQQVFYSSATAEQDLLSVAALFAFPFTRSQLTEIYQRFTRQNGNQAFLQLRRRALLREFADGYLELPPLLQAVAQAHVTGDSKERSKERYRSAAAFLAESEPKEVLPLLNALYLYRKAQEFNEAATVALDLIGGSLLPYSPMLAQQILMAFKQEEVSPEHWIWLLGERGVVAGHLRQDEEETRCYREMLRLAKAQGNQEAQALAYQRLGISSFYSDTQIAEAFYLQSLALYEELSNLRGQSQIHNNLALLFEKLGEVSRAQAALEKALQLHQQLNSAPWEYLAVYSNLGVFAARQEQWERAYHFSKEAEKIARECEAPHEIARAIFNLGRYDMTLTKTDSMCERFDEALAVADKYQLKDIEELVCSSYARFHYDAGRPKESLAYLQRVANVQEALQDKRKLAGTYVELATAYWRNHETEQSLQFIRRSLALFEYLKESDGLEQLLSNITAICLDLKNDDETERVYLALKLLRRRLRGRQPSYLLARVCRALGQFRISTGRYDQLAHHYFTTEINLLAALERTSEQLQSMMNVGQIHQQFGSLPQAVLINQEAIVLAAQTGERKTQACLHYNLANCFIEAEEYAEAESAYRAAHGIALELSLKDLQQKIEHNLGETLRRAEKSTEAIEWMNAGYSHAKELDDPEGQIQALNNLGLAYEKLKESAKALDHFERALALCKEHGFQREEANILISFGNFYYRDEPAKARDYYQQSLRTARAAEDAEMEEKAMVSLIYVCRKLGIADEIQADLQIAVNQALQSHNYVHLIEYCTLVGEINLDEDGFEPAAEMFEKAFIFALMADVQRRQRMLADEDESETVQMVFQLIATLNELVVKDKLAIARKFYDALMGNLSRMPQLEPSNPLLKTLSIIGNFFDADTKLSLEDYVMGQFNTVDSDGA